MPNLKLVKDQTSTSRLSASTDHVVDLLNEFGLPLTRDNYLNLAYPEGLPSDWSQSDELSLPENIRLLDSD